jgi:hypothetical protein
MNLNLIILIKYILFMIYLFVNMINYLIEFDLKMTILFIENEYLI